MTHSFLVVLDQGVPDAAHGRLDLGVRVKLIPVQFRHDLGQVGVELFPCLSSNCAETKGRSLQQIHRVTSMHQLKL